MKNEILSTLEILILTLLTINIMQMRALLNLKYTIYKYTHSPHKKYI